MPNKQSAIKELRKTKKRTQHNIRIKTRVKQLFKLCNELIVSGNIEEAKKTALQFQKMVDKAAKENVISENRSRRKKSALMKLMATKK
ncbi:MAG: 30S ribosomal protein S20 [Patescibacteria group bacterium]|jgi:small subunit ribosomal protein S20